MATPLLRQIKSKASQPGQSGRDLPLQVVQRKDTAAMESLMAGDVDVNAVTTSGMTPLISAAVDGHLGIVRALLKRGAAVNQKRNDGFTALSLAAFFGHEQVVRELLSHGADIRAEDKSRTSAEMWAEARSQTTISDLLREIRERSAEMVSPETVPASEAIVSQPSPQPLPARANDIASPETVPASKPMVSQPSPQPLPAGRANDIASAKTVLVSEPILPQPSPQPSPADKDIEDLNETTIIRQRAATVEVRVVAEDWDDAGFPEGSIRRVGGGKSATSSTMITLEDRVHNVAAFSPFSALVDRLTSSWKQVAVVMLVVILLSGAVTFATVKAIVRKAKPSPVQAIGTTSVPVEPAQPTSLPNQPAASLADAQTKTSPEVSTGQGSADAIQRESSEDASPQQSSHSKAAVLRDLTNDGAASDSETKPGTEKPKSRYSNRPVSEVARRHTTRRRSESTTSDGEVRNGSTRSNEPAAIKIVSEPPAKQVKPASSSKEIQAQPTTPLEGSSPKRKVIQWP